MPRPTAIEAARRFRGQLEAGEADAAERMARTYGRIYQSLQDQLVGLAEEIAAMEEPTRGKIMKFARTEQLLRQVEQQVTRFGGTVQNEVDVITQRAVDQGSADALRLIEASLPELPPGIRGEIINSFNRLPSEAIESMTGMLETEGVLFERLEKTFDQYVVGQVRDHLLDGLAKGQNPRTIARLLEKNVLKGLGSGLTSTMTTVRTAQIKAYQTANHATFAANNKIVPKWVWVSALDNRTCMSCIAQHGKEFPYTETLNDHHNGRCVPVPKTISYRDLGIDRPDPVPPFESGEDWFNRQSEATQREMMGPGKFDVWKSGKFAFEDLSREYNNLVYGDLRREATLWELTRGRPPKVDREKWSTEFWKTQKEVDFIKESGELYPGELQATEDKLLAEREISVAARQRGNTPGQMTTADWSNLADDMKSEAGYALKLSTESGRQAGGNRAVGRRRLQIGEREIIQVGGQDIERTWTGGSQRAARQATQRINKETQESAREYMTGRLTDLGYKQKTVSELSYTQQRRLLAEVGHGQPQGASIAGIPKAERTAVIDQASPRQRADSLEVAFNPRAAEGMKRWEYYEISMVKAGREAEIELPPDNREQIIPGYVQYPGGKKPEPALIGEIPF